LQSISRQKERPFEVIVVDNNSTDDSAKIASSFPFVNLVREPKQGVIHARATGFDKATGEIIGRIDADTILPADWTKSVLQIFENENVDAVSGSAIYYDMAGSRLASRLDLMVRRLFARHLSGNLYLWGANMAVRKYAWNSVRDTLCNCGLIHEDQDLALHLQDIGKTVIFDEDMLAYVSSRRIDTGYFNFISYTKRGVDTYAHHNSPGKAYLRMLVVAATIGYLPALILHRIYDQKTGKTSLLSIKQNITPRIDPTSNVA
jgi:glycosyltransferase involved in cell wall biosynthesis